MMNEQLYLFLDDYRYTSGLPGFKINKKKNRVSVYPSATGLNWFLALMMLGLGVFIMARGEVLVGLLGFGMGMILLGSLSKCTVFDIEEKTIRTSYFFFFDMDCVKERWITRFHTTLQTVSVGRVKKNKSYAFDLFYKQSPEDQEAMIKGIAYFNDAEGLGKFAGVVTRILQEMSATATP